MGKDLRKEKGDPRKKKREKKRREYGVGRTLLSMLGKRTLQRVLAVGKDCVCMFEF